MSDQYHEDWRQRYPKETLIQHKSRDKARHAQEDAFFRGIFGRSSGNRDRLRDWILDHARSSLQDAAARAYLDVVNLRSVGEDGVFLSEGSTRVLAWWSVEHAQGEHVVSASRRFACGVVEEVDGTFSPDSTGITYDRTSDTYTINGTRVTTDALNMAHEDAPRV